MEDRRGTVTEAWTGPQVAWKMARGSPGAFGGKTLNSVPVWLALCAAFFIGLADLRRPLSVRNLDLLALLSFSISLRFFNGGDIFTSAPLAYPPLVYLLARMTWIGFRGRTGVSGQPVWPVWLLAAATVFLVGFRIGLNVTQPKPNVIDVGYSGVVGAHRIANGQSPYGHFPPRTIRSERAASRTPTARCATASRRTGAASRPTSAATRTGRSRTSPTCPRTCCSGGAESGTPAHGSCHVDRLRPGCVGSARARRPSLRRLPPRRDARLRVGVVPFTQYVLSSNTNDAIPPSCCCSAS